MTYYADFDNTGYTGRRSFNTLSGAIAEAQDWLDRGGDRRAVVADKNGVVKFHQGYSEFWFSL